MSDANPYSPAADPAFPNDPLLIQKVGVQPIQLFQRSYRLIGDQYWLFLGISVVGLLVGSAVPFAILLGPMLIGIYLSFQARTRGERVEFAHLFRGFDQFQDGLIATLILLAVSFLIMVPIVLLFVAVVFGVIAAQADGGGPNGTASPTLIIVFLMFYPMIIFANLLTALPFAFVFQLIADRKMGAVDAVKASVSGVLRNFWGVLWYLIVTFAFSFVLMIFCYIPAILFMPISFGATYLLYLDVFAQQSQHPSHAGSPA